MKKLNKIALFALFLLISANVTALENSSLRFGAELDGQRSLAVFRQIIFRELVSNVRLQSPFIRARDGESFGVDDIGSDSILREQLNHSILQVKPTGMAIRMTKNVSMQ